jgi:hypothetical protein
LVGEDGMALVELWWSIANDPMRRDRDRLEASKLLADRGWGKAAAYEPQEDPFDLEEVEAAAEGVSEEGSKAGSGRAGERLGLLRPT